MNVGDTVRVNVPGDAWHGKTAQVEAVYEAGVSLYIDDGNRDDAALFAHDEVTAVEQPHQEFGIGRLSRDTDPASEAVAELEAAEITSRNSRTEGLELCDCGHRVAPMLVMSASLGTACPNCYDEMSG